MKFLIACEESGAVRDRLTAAGHDAMSCDLKDSRTEGKHYKGDIRDILYTGWADCLIGFPPCTHLAVSGAKHFPEKIADGRQQQGIDFFMTLVNAPIKHKALENPICIMSTVYRKPDQIIQPYYFGDPYKKTTCLWLFDLPPLYHNATATMFDPVVTHVEQGEFYEFTEKKTGKTKKMPLWYAQAKGFAGGKAGDFSEMRSKTFPGIAQAMAMQWGAYLNDKYKK